MALLAGNDAAAVIPHDSSQCKVHNRQCSLNSIDKKDLFGPCIDESDTDSATTLPNAQVVAVAGVKTMQQVIITFHTTLSWEGHAKHDVVDR